MSKPGYGPGEMERTAEFFRKYPLGNIVDAAIAVYGENTKFSRRYVQLNVSVLFGKESEENRRMEEQWTRENLKE